MKRSEILSAVLNAIENREPNAAGWFWLCYKDGEIKCLAGGDLPQPEIWFCKLTAKQVYNGLTSPEWSAIESRIFNILNQKGM